MKQTTPTENDYWAVKARINTALETLRRDLRQMHEQDLVLFRQLMTIHSTIYRMGGHRRNCRSYDCEDEARGNMAAETLPRRKPPLNRGCSTPVDLPNVLDEEDAEEEDEEETTNFLAKSFNSTVSEPANHKLSTLVCGNSGPFPVPFCHELHIVSPKLVRSYQVRSQSTLSPRIPTSLWTDTPSQSPTSPPVFSTPHEDIGAPEREHSDDGCEIRKWRGLWDDEEASSKRRMWYSTLLKRSCQIWKTVQQDHNDREIFI